MATGTAAFPGRPYTLRIEVWYNWQSGTQASMHIEGWIDGTWGSYSGSGSAFQVYVDTVGNVYNWSGGYDFRNGSSFHIYTGDYIVSVNANGDAGAQIYAQYDSLGSTSVGTWYDGTPPSPPNAPTMNNTSAVTTTSFTANYTRGSNNGNSIDKDQVQWATNSNFSTVVWDDTPPNGNPSGASNPSGGTPPVSLTPGTTHWVRARSHNVNGWSGWSNSISQATLPAVAPGMTVTATPSGLSATVTLTPPGGVSGVTAYNIERRLAGTTTATPYTTSSPTYAITGLTPGAAYEYRASATYSPTYTSPWTSWTQVIQPNPSTSPGDYFDGSTGPTADQTYRWTGTANASSSEAVSHGVTGWLTFAQGATVSNGTGTVAQVSDARSGTMGARVTFWTDATAAGFRVGTAHTDPGRTDVTESAVYVGIISVKLSRSQRLAAEIMWTTAAGGLLTPTLGTASVVSAGVWTQLVVTGTAPPTADWASIRVVDVSGTGWSVWLGGDTITADAAMITLGSIPIDYFDGSLPDGGGYMYSWMGATNASASIREAVAPNFADELLDPDCPPLPLPPRPPAIPDLCITDVGLWRRYYATIPATEVSDWLDVLPTFDLTTYTLAERQVRIRIYANPFNYPMEQVDTTNWCAEQIISYIPANTIITLDGELQRVFASVRGGATQAADHLLYGTGGTPPTWPVLSCGMSYLVSFDTPVGGDAPPPGNITPVVTLTRRT